MTSPLCQKSHDLVAWTTKVLAGELTTQILHKLFFSTTNATKTFIPCPRQQNPNNNVGVLLSLAPLSSRYKTMLRLGRLLSSVKVATTLRPCLAKSRERTRRVTMSHVATTTSNNNSNATRNPTSVKLVGGNVGCWRRRHRVPILRPLRRMIPSRRLPF